MGHRTASSRKANNKKIRLLRRKNSMIDQPSSPAARTSSSGEVRHTQTSQSSTPLTAPALHLRGSSPGPGARVYTAGKHSRRRLKVTRKPPVSARLTHNEVRNVTVSPSLFLLTKFISAASSAGLFSSSSSTAFFVLCFGRAMGKCVANGLFPSVSHLCPLIAPLPAVPAPPLAFAPSFPVTLVPSRGAVRAASATGGCAAEAGMPADGGPKPLATESTSDNGGDSGCSADAKPLRLAPAKPAVRAAACPRARLPPTSTAGRTALALGWEGWAVFGSCTASTHNS
mmetsp:Transcript_88179/g.244724  ORF Transcript_88179/g.244724 Transcript_88179/m.244724 type:complete len:285 (-) Transcript_88179:163-1017(-)